MKKTLVIVIHPTMETSVVNKRWTQELHKFPDRYVVHPLYETYPDGNIDVSAEQDLIERYDNIVFQFPYYWFNSPPLFKKWLDEVLTHGWAYGSKSGYRLSGKKIALAISLGSDEDEYSASGVYKYTLEELTRPFQLTFEYVKADYRPLFAFYGIEYDTSADHIEKSVPQYLHFLDSM
ncbi:MAG: NAD(P)H-dependent oxidoreductase [Sediminicola sp.]